MFCVLFPSTRNEQKRSTRDLVKTKDEGEGSEPGDTQCK